MRKSYSYLGELERIPHEVHQDSPQSALFATHHPALFKRIRTSCRGMEWFSYLLPHVYVYNRFHMR